MLIMDLKKNSKISKIKIENEFQCSESGLNKIQFFKEKYVKWFIKKYIYIR